jgi:hypothetical protein
MRSAIPAAVSSFRALHDSGCFVMPNPWDVGSALCLRRLRFKALATSSAGFALTRGLPDSRPVGQALGRGARVAWGAFIRAAEGVAETGTFDSLAGAAPFSDLNAVFAGRRSS